MIIQALLDIQQRHGYLPQEELEFLDLRADVPLYRIEEVTTYFPYFRRREPSDPEPPEVTLRVCRSMTCHLRGAAELLASARQLAGLQKPSPLAVEGVSCLGRCDRAPVAFVSRHRGPGEHFHDRLYTDLAGKRPLERLLADV